jgi:hypothetical protein
MQLVSCRDEVFLCGSIVDVSGRQGVAVRNNAGQINLFLSFLV